MIATKRSLKKREKVSSANMPRNPRESLITSAAWEQAITEPAVIASRNSIHHFAAASYVFPPMTVAMRSIEAPIARTISGMSTTVSFQFTYEPRRRVPDL